MNLHIIVISLVPQKERVGLALLFLVALELLGCHSVLIALVDPPKGINKFVYLSVYYVCVSYRMTPNPHQIYRFTISYYNESWYAMTVYSSFHLWHRMCQHSLHAERKNCLFWKWKQPQLLTWDLTIPLYIKFRKVSSTIKIRYKNRYIFLKLSLVVIHMCWYRHCKSVAW